MDEEEHDDAGGDEEEEQVTVIPDPELRPLGGVKYEDTRVHKNTLLFLGDLKENNERAWLKSHDPEFRRALKDWESFVETLTAKIIEVDETVPELPLKDVVFRIYRDVRFSREKTPYKPNFSAAWSRTGRKGDYACYYVHVEPGECFVGGGLWHPDAAALGRLRAHIDAHPERLRAVLMAPDFRRTFLPETAGKANSSEADVVKAFAKRNREGALKTKPKNYAADHRDVALLKLRNFTIGQKIKDGDLQRKDAQEYIMELIRPMVEFVSFLNSVVKPDPGEGSEDELAESEEDPEQDLDDEQDDAEA
ncbi:hypothetical protein GGR56DRAFT_636649 [Xylariaceae sp. FL0804]|nr:hypothetical protein GGR56DRAFT_636649 [Xylariaceae sp. FL0804]